MKKPNPFILVIFGASGDLTMRKLIPALYHLYNKQLLPENFAVLGIGRTEFTNESYREKVAEFKPEIDYSADFLSNIGYLAIDTQAVADYAQLKQRLADLDQIHDTGGTYIYYLATPPSLYQPISDCLGAHQLNVGDKKIIIEKPFGYDLATGQALNRHLLTVFEENQIYRIDHYLGKETVQNILVSRFSNGLFEPLWNRNFIHHVEITSAENLGVEARGGYYETSGALRDMVQNHLLQIVGLIAMEPPAVINSDSIRNETLKIFQALRPITEDDVEKYAIRGQYTASVIKGKHENGYREEKGVAPDSLTETYAAIKFYIDNWRWGGVPFFIRTGKRLPTKVTEVVIHFKPTPHPLFCNYPSGLTNSNQLIIRIQPDEGILLKLGMKVPGSGFNVQTVNMDFRYADLAESQQPEAYERLLHDCMIGDSTLYLRGDAVEATWRFVDPILKAWKHNRHIKMYGYPAGSWGPDVADDMFDDPTHTWRYPCKNLAEDGLYCEL